MPTINLIEINTENNDYSLRLSDETFINGIICKIFETNSNYQITNRDVTDKDLLYSDENLQPLQVL